MPLSSAGPRVQPKDALVHGKSCRVHATLQPRSEVDADTEAVTASRYPRRRMDVTLTLGFSEDTFASTLQHVPLRELMHKL